MSASPHPSREVLERFLRNELDAGQRRAVVAHLLSGCDRCRGAMAPAAALLFSPSRRRPLPSPRQVARYDRPVFAAAERAIALTGRLAAERRAAPRGLFLLRSCEGGLRDNLFAAPGFLTWGLVELLLEESRRRKGDDPEQALSFAELATEVVARLDPALYGAQPLCRLAAEAWGERGNAARILGLWAEADQALGSAFERAWEAGGEPRQIAHLCELSASLYGDRRLFAEAFAVLDRAHELYAKARAGHEAGRTLIKKGLFALYAQAPGRAMELLARGLQAIDRAREPRLVWIALHNMVFCEVELGGFRQARRLLFDLQPLYAIHSGQIDKIKVRGVEGRIAAGLGELRRAERAFVAVRQAFQEAGLPYQAGLAGLDLAAVWLRQRRVEEAAKLVEELAELFEGLRVDREAIACMLLLREAFTVRQATAALIEDIARLLRGLETRQVPLHRRPGRSG